MTLALFINVLIIIIIIIIVWVSTISLKSADRTDIGSLKVAVLFFTRALLEQKG